MFSNTLKLIKIKIEKNNLQNICKKSNQIFKIKHCYFLSLKGFSISMNCYMDAKPPTHVSSNQFLIKCLWIHLKKNYAQPKELQILANTYNIKFFLLQFKRQRSFNYCQFFSSMTFLILKWFNCSLTINNAIFSHTNF